MVFFLNGVKFRAFNNNRAFILFQFDVVFSQYPLLTFFLYSKQLEGGRDHLQLKGLAKAAMTIDAFIEQ